MTFQNKRYKLSPFVLLYGFGTCLALGQATGNKPISDEATAIYRTFLSSYHVDSSWGSLRIGKQTVAFSPNAAPEATDECLKSLNLPESTDTTLHQLSSAIIPSRIKGVLVDPGLEDEKIAAKEGLSRPQTGGSHIRRDKQAHILRLSEIVFNADHTRAVVSYSFVCGMLCGEGGAALFENHNGNWGFVKYVCGKWVS